MQFRLFSLALIVLNCVDHSHCQPHHWKRSKRGCRLENCEFCFSKDFCTKCRPGYYLHRGRCFEDCPEGLAPLEDSMECGDGCEVGPWSDWGTCTRRNRTCGFKWGLETRTRPIVKKPPRDSILCPTIAESRRCRMPKRHCRKGSGKQRSKHKDSSSTRRDLKRKSQRSLQAQAQDQHSAHLSTARPRPRHRRFASWDKAAAPQCQAPLSQ